MSQPKGCKCDFHSYMVGDGCEVCNPGKALEYAQETIQELRTALHDLVVVCPRNLECGAFHHTKRDQHGDDEPCRCRHAYASAIESAEDLLMVTP